MSVITPSLLGVRLSKQLDQLKENFFTLLRHAKSLIALRCVQGDNMNKFFTISSPITANI